jgi:hypothetical protein
MDEPLSPVESMIFWGSPFGRSWFLSILGFN